MENMIISVLGDYMGCAWSDVPIPGDLNPGYAAVLPAAATQYVGPVGTRVRWLWAISEALRAYEIRRGGVPRWITLAPDRLWDLRGFPATLVDKWPDEACLLLSQNLARLITDGMRIDITKLKPEDKATFLQGRDAAVALNMQRRATRGMGTPALLAG